MLKSFQSSRGWVVAFFMVGSAHAGVTISPFVGKLPAGICRIEMHFGTETQSFGSGQCTASVIGKSTLLTAAHCVSDWRKDAVSEAKRRGLRSVRLMGRVGCTNQVGKEPTHYRYFSPKNVKIHPKYNGQTRNDVATIDLGGEKFSSPPIQVISREADLAALAAKSPECVAVGFGMDQVKVGTTGKLFAGNMQFPLISRASREFVRFETDVKITSILEGDSGGPLLCRARGTSEFFQVGINSKTGETERVGTGFDQNGRIVQVVQTRVEKNYFTPTMIPSNADFVF
jgi:hypothetical protein